MSDQTAEVLASRLISFIVNSNTDVKTYTIHSKLISRQSPVLDKMISSGMKEDMTGEVHLEDVDHDTFVRFAEWLYGGDYSPATALVIPDHDDNDDNDNNDSSGGGQADQHHDNAEPMTLQELMASLEVEDTAPSFQLCKNAKLGHQLPPPSPEPQPETPAQMLRRLRAPITNIDLPMYHTTSFPVLESSSTDPDLTYSYSEILSHVQLYAFAHKYAIEQLQHLILHKLRDALAQTNFHTDHASEYLETLALGFNSTLDLDGTEPLRRLLTLFGALHFKDIARVPSFESFAEKQGECVVQLCREVARRL